MTEEFRNRNEHPETPVFNSLRRSPDSYGNSLHDELFESALERNIHGGSNEIIVVMGPIGAGKTTIVSELLYLTQHEFVLNGFPGHRRLIKYAGFEDAQRFVTAAGIVRDDDEESQATRMHYREANNIFATEIRDAVDIGNLVFVECPGMVGRGDKAIEDIALHRGIMQEVEYNASFFFITSEHEERDKVREGFEEDPLSKLDVLENIGTNVRLPEEGGIGSIGGGGKTAIGRFDLSLKKYLYELVRQGIATNDFYTQNATSPEFFNSAVARELFFENLYAKWFFGERLGVPADKVFVGRNDHTDVRTLNQNELVIYNTIRQRR